MQIKNILGKKLLSLSNKIGNSCTTSFFTVGMEKMPQHLKKNR